MDHTHPYQQKIRPSHAYLCKTEPFWRRRRRSSKKRQGILYEERVHEYFAEHYGPSYIPGLWVEYEVYGDIYLHRCQPDALLINVHTGIIVVIEIKLKHTEKAYYRLETLYLPVLSLLFSREYWTLVPCEVVKWFDPSCAFPVPVELCSEPSLAKDSSKFHACIQHI